MDPGVSVQKQNFTRNPEKLAKVLEPERKPKVIYTDNSFEFGKACEDLSWNHCTSNTTQIGNNGIAERAVRRVKKGTSAVLLAIRSKWKLVGRFHGMWNHICETSRSLVWWKTPCERRFGEPFKGPNYSFGSLVEFFTHLCERPVKGWRPWRVGNDGRIGNLLWTTQCKGSNISKKNGKFIFPVVDGGKKLLEEIRNWEHPPWYGTSNSRRE